jgi:hypothetical protein
VKELSPAAGGDSVVVASSDTTSLSPLEPVSGVASERGIGESTLLPAGNLGVSPPVESVSGSCVSVAAIAATASADTTGGRVTTPAKEGRLRSVKGVSSSALVR